MSGQFLSPVMSPEFSCKRSKLVLLVQCDVLGVGGIVCGAHKDSSLVSDYSGHLL